MAEAATKQQRGRVKASLTRLTNKLDLDLTKNEITLWLQRLDQLFLEFDKLDSMLPEKDSEIEEFEEKFIETKARFQDKLDALNHKALIPENTNNVINTIGNFKLPKLNIPIFSGNFKDWTNFKDLFVATVHNTSLPKIQKFQYLKGLLDNEPASIIKHIPLSENSYDEAWEKLLARYDKKKQIVHALIKTFLEQKPVVNVNSVNLRQLNDCSDEIIRGLRALGEEAASRDPWLIFLLLQKVDPETKKLWAQETADVDFPTLESFFDFLNTRCSSLEIMVNSETEVKNYYKSNVVNAKPTNNVKPHLKCPKCAANHQLHKCSKFIDMDIAVRKNFVKKQNLCYLCFKAHQVKNCPLTYLKCNICESKLHNTLLHEQKSSSFLSNSKSETCKNCSETSIPPAPDTQSVGVSGDGVIANTLMKKEKSVSFLPTAVAYAQNSIGEKIKIRVLIDSGSECNFLSESAVQMLGLKRKKKTIPISGIGGSFFGHTRGIACLKIGSRFTDEMIEIEAHILNKVTSNLPAEYIDVSELDYLKSINLADENFMEPSECQLILGADSALRIMRCSQILGTKNQPIAQNTIFGWVVAGKIRKHCEESVITHSHFVNINEDSNVDLILQKFWQAEELPTLKSDLSEEEEFCERHFAENYQISHDGRFVVKLPVFKDNSNLGNSKNLAVSRLLSMERKFRNNPDFEREYKSFMQDYEDRSHMTLVEKEVTPNDKKIYHLPHHAVVREDSLSTKFRVVFDGSCKPGNTCSLNSILGVGKTLQPDIFSILIRFRLSEVAFSADIQQMYRQILISPEDQDLQRIVWRKSPDEKIQEFRLSTVTYGTSCAPFLATRALWQIGLDSEKEFPVISSIIKNSFYMDDLMAGSPNCQEAIATVEKLTEILDSRGFHLRKWKSNSSDFLAHLSTKPQEINSLEIHPDECSKTLGLLWDCTRDSYIFKVNFVFENEITKRKFLSQSAKLFDPLGFLSPCTISVKIFYQQLWLHKLNWDSPLPDNLAEKWRNFQREFENVSVIEIPRWLHTTSKEITVHGFCDASELAYAAVMYAVQKTENGCSKVTILAAKSKVAPLKPISIPRLELNGALLLSKLFAAISRILQDYTITFHAHSDSQVVLSWLSSSPRTWKPYVANRTAEILELVPGERWRYVPSSQNPADLATRGLSPKLLPECKLWFCGPHWLSMTEQNWPKQTKHKTDHNLNLKVVKEKKSKNVYNVSLKYNDVIDTLFEKCSTLSKIVNILVYCIRFIDQCKRSVSSSGKSRYDEGKQLAINTVERKKAMNVIILYVQRVYFEEEIKCLKGNKDLFGTSCLKTLCPFMDDDGLLRVGGRLINSPLPFNVKHPVILPAQHKLCVYIIKKFHITYLHAGPTLLLNILRQTYWIIGARKLIRSYIHKCIVCCKYRSSSANQLMGDLPRQRVTPNRPFLVCGVDFAGPISILRYRGRGAKSIKGYIALFVCFSTKAIHLECVSDLTSEAFIAALRRFSCRRGSPKHIHCDNATNFYGSKRKLSELYKFVSNINSDDNICYYLSQVSIQWHMIPPSSPHFGGLWESGVKSVKFHLKRVIGDHKLTFEELTTLLAQTEAVLNSRPLTPVNDDVDSLEVLTPAHFLIGETMTSPPEQVNPDKLSLRSRWNLIQKMKIDFWKRWYKDYLSSLQNRKKWNTIKPNINVNDLVLIKEDNVPPSCWPLGRVINVHPGQDGAVRVVTVKTTKGCFKRPIVKLCLLPLHPE